MKYQTKIQIMMRKKEETEKLARKLKFKNLIPLKEIEYVILIISVELE